MRQRDVSKIPLVLLAAVLGNGSFLFGQGLPVLLNADPTKDTYELISDVLGPTPDNSDCSHQDFGEHITQAWDEDLGKYVFVFNMHMAAGATGVTNLDVCDGHDYEDRQREEIKTERPNSPDYLLGTADSTVTYTWRFKLPDGFTVSKYFTHIHQLKSQGADDGDTDPIIALTPVTIGSGSHAEDMMVLQYYDGASSNAITLAEMPLQSFVGNWVLVREQVTWGDSNNFQGQYAIVMTASDDTQLCYSNYVGGPCYDDTHNLNLWRAGGNVVVRPKWGCYRKVKDDMGGDLALRDEQVSMSDFWLAKWTCDCCGNARNAVARPGRATISTGFARAHLGAFDELGVLPRTANARAFGAIH